MTEVFRTMTLAEQQGYLPKDSMNKLQKSFETIAKAQGISVSQLLLKQYITSGNNVNKDNYEDVYNDITGALNQLRLPGNELPEEWSDMETQLKGDLVQETDFKPFDISQKVGKEYDDWHAAPNAKNFTKLFHALHVNASVTSPPVIEESKPSSEGRGSNQSGFLRNLFAARTARVASSGSAELETQVSDEGAGRPSRPSNPVGKLFPLFCKCYCSSRYNREEEAPRVNIKNFSDYSSCWVRLRRK